MFLLIIYNFFYIYVCWLFSSSFFFSRSLARWYSVVLVVDLLLYYSNYDLTYYSYLIWTIIVLTLVNNSCFLLLSVYNNYLDCIASFTNILFIQYVHFGSYSKLPSLSNLELQFLILF